MKHSMYGFYNANLPIEHGTVLTVWVSWTQSTNQSQTIPRTLSSDEQFPEHYQVLNNSQNTIKRWVII